jgi:ribosomal-protein-alanine N-acetyltransferase
MIEAVLPESTDLPASITTAGTADAELIAALHARCFDSRREDPWDADLVRRILASPGSLGLLASRPSAAGQRRPGIAGEQQPVGFALCRAVAGEAELFALGVVEAHRRHGVGALLLAAVVWHAARLGGRVMFLEVAADNTAAQRLYRRAGFAAIGRRPGYYARAAGEVVDADVMGRALVGLEGRGGRG